MVTNKKVVSLEKGNDFRRASQQFSFLSEENLPFRGYYLDKYSLLVCSSDHESTMSRNMGFIHNKAP
ncbi:hypothetical protein C1O40_03930 [Akkermansia muciniphila]|jgi:hypothetical protein|nr:hypothetical protein C1O40_03930 [Akkermansia muciniphila]